MKRALLAAVSISLLAAMVVSAGRVNYVTHFNSDGTKKTIYASQGSCVHHLRDHPGDFVAQANNTVSYEPNACN